MENAFQRQDRLEHLGEQITELAGHLTAQHVEQQVRWYRRAKRLEALNEENRRYAHRELAVYPDDDGSWVIRERLTAEQGALIAKALEAAQNQAFEEQRDEPDAVEREIDRAECVMGFAEPVAQRRADALERVARNYLVGPEASDSGGDRYLVNLHTDIETLRVNGVGAAANLDDRAEFPAETSRRLSCDASLIQWLECRSAPCARPGRCGRPQGGLLQVGGETKMDNLVLLCRRHHRLVHEGGFGLESRPDRSFRFSLPDGTHLPDAPDGRSRGNFDAIRAANEADGLHIDPRTIVPNWGGEEMDPHLAVLELIQRE